MRSTVNDNNALKHQIQKLTQLQKQQQNSTLCNPRCDTKNTCGNPLSNRQSRCLEAKGALNNITTKTTTATTTSREPPQLVQHLLQRYYSYMLLPLVHRSVISLGNCLWFCSSQLLPCHKLNSKGYQQSSTAASKTKNTIASASASATTTQLIVINTYITSSNHTHRLYENTTNTISNKRYLTRSPSLFLLTLLLLWFSHLIGSSYAAPQSCILCDIEDFKDGSSNGRPYEEYHFEHQVTRVDAITAMKIFNVTSFDVEPSNCAISCSDKVMKYCLGPQFINDHCWCELGHAEEGLPFVPHICYVGEKHYKAVVGSCYFYEQVKECCCAPALATQWRHISSASRHTNTGSLLQLTILTLLINTARQQKNRF